MPHARTLIALTVLLVQSLVSWTQDTSIRHAVASAECAAETVEADGDSIHADAPAGTEAGRDLSVTPQELSSPMMTDTHADSYIENWWTRVTDFAGDHPLLCVLIAYAGVWAICRVLRKILIARI